MRREDCELGMSVIFGRGKGEQTKGIIRKLNLKTAKVETTENRGSKTTAGVKWSVGYSLMRPAGSQVVSDADADAEPYPFNIFTRGADKCIMEAIFSCYMDLSPENLSCDGELSRNQVLARSRELETKLNHLFKALGRPVNEDVAYNWYQEKTAWEQKQKEKRA